MKDEGCSMKIPNWFLWIILLAFSTQNSLHGMKPLRFLIHSS